MDKEVSAGLYKMVKEKLKGVSAQIKALGIASRIGVKLDKEGIKYYCAETIELIDDVGKEIDRLFAVMD